MFSFYSEAQLPALEEESYWGMAFDGRMYYLTVRSERKISVLNRALCLIRQASTQRCYTAICFDSRRDCFWAASEESLLSLFQLNRSFEEIGEIKLDGSEDELGMLNSVTFCCETGRLLVSLGNKLIEVEPQDGQSCLLREEPDCAMILAAACLPPYIIFVVLRSGGTCFVLTERDGTTIAEETACEMPLATALVLDPCRMPCGEFDLLALTSSCDGCPFLLRARLGRELSEKMRCCNWQLCCEEECCTIGCNACCGVCSILESIAIQEAALAHILNGEGEKLQRAIECADSIRELLCIDESVQRTIRCVTRLEEVLLAKLEEVRKICGSDACVD